MEEMVSAPPHFSGVLAVKCYKYADTAVKILEELGLL